MERIVQGSEGFLSPLIALSHPVVPAPLCDALFQAKKRVSFCKNYLIGHALQALKSDSFKVEMPLTKSPAQWPFHLLV